MCTNNCPNMYLRSPPRGGCCPQLCLVLCTLLLVSSQTVTCGQWLGQILTEGPFFATSGQPLMLASGPATAGDGADIAIGDMDGDGMADLLAGSLYGDLVYYRCLGDNQWAAPQVLLNENDEIWRWPPVAKQASPELADWNGDGQLDLILGYGGKLFWYHRRGLQLGVGRSVCLPDGRPVAEVIGEMASAAGHLAPCAADFDGDGDVDLLLGSDDGYVWWVENQGSAGAGELAIPQLLGAGGTPLKVDGRARVCVGDYNSDGRQDLIIGDAAGHLWWCPGRSDGLASLRRINLPQRPSDWPGGLCPRLVVRTREIWLGDADGFIGRLDIVAAGKIGWRGYLVAEDVPLDVGRAAAVCALDWNGDGRLDLVAGNAAGEVAMYERLRPWDGWWLAPGKSIRTATGTLKAAGGYAWPRATDADGDGDIDLFVGTGAGTVELWVNSGGFIRVGPIAVAGQPIQTAGRATVAAVDYDRDGDVDLFVGSKCPEGLVRGSATIPSDRVAYFEHVANHRHSVPVFNKGALLDMYIGSSSHTGADLDARILKPQLVEPISSHIHSRTDFLVTADLGVFLFTTMRRRGDYPLLTSIPPSQQLPAPLLPAAYCAYLAESGQSGRPVLLCGTNEYGMVYAYDAVSKGITP